MKLLVLSMCYLIHTALGYKLVPLTVHRAYGKRMSFDHLLATLLVLCIPVAGVLEATPYSEPAFLTGIGMFCVGGILTIAAMRENPFFQPEIEKPLFKVETGVYRLLDHPGYTGMAMQAGGAALIMNTRWGLVPLVLYVTLLLWRGHKESALLDEL